ncbi:TfuA-like protein [Streptomyces iakyrus]|uniref:TfuA-like protein n=1 Tax=Streptomyces iakyrus TaxID=68219 RepID=UPI0037F339C7
MGVHIFTGPTAVGEAAVEMLSSCCIHPPARHGDFLHNGFSEGDVVVLIDGLYHGNPPIRHKEILDALTRGVTVIGAASMGALRAAELHPFGMIGVGQIFEMYRDAEIDSDDEVAVLHSDGPDWTVLSEALVNMRHTLRLAEQAGLVTPAERTELLETARGLHYPRRSWRAVARACKGDEALHAAAQRVLNFHAGPAGRSNLKFEDALAALQYARELLGTGRTMVSDERQMHWPDGWRTTYLRRWISEFTGSHMHGRFVSLAAQFDYQRLFGPDQPERWRRYVLGILSGLNHEAPLCQLEDAALNAAAARGVTGVAVRRAGAGNWLTADEERTLEDRERILTVLIRSSRLTVDLVDARTARQLLPQQRCNAELISTSLHINEQIAQTSFSKHTDHLKQSVLLRHLRLLWNLPSTCASRELDAAAQDRGFPSAGEAAESLRPFFLKDHHERRNYGA